MYMLLMIAISLTKGKSPPPFTFNLAQSIPSKELTFPFLSSYDSAPLSINESVQLKKIFDGIPSFLAEQKSKMNAPGVSLTVAHNGKTIYSESIGSASAESQTPLTDQTQYWIASNTKMFTSVMLFMMRDSGLLPYGGLDTPLNVLLPSYSINPPIGARISRRPVTLRSLVMHVSGLPREIPTLMSSDPLAKQEAMVLAEVANLTALSLPFVSTSYSNLGFALLGRALEKATGMSWEAFVSTRILIPLRMSDTGFFGYGNPPANIAQGVNRISGKVEPIPNTIYWGNPAGFMYSSPRDMTRWINFLMGIGPETDNEVLDLVTRNEMRHTGFFHSDGISGVSAGAFELAHLQGHWTKNKLGGAPGFRSSITLVPELGLGIFGVVTASGSGDFYSDGDMVIFPILNQLIPEVEKILTSRATKSYTVPPGNFLQRAIGVYGKNELQLEFDHELGVPLLVYRPVPPFNGPSYVLHWETSEALKYVFHFVQGPDTTYNVSWTGCNSKQYPGEDICPVSCNRIFADGVGTVGLTGVLDISNSQTAIHFLNDGHIAYKLDRLYNLSKSL